MRYAVVVASLLVAGCTLPNPEWSGDNGGQGGVGGGGVGGGGGGADGGVSDLSTSGAHDLAAPPDLAPALCSGDQRRCQTGPVASQACMAGHFVDSRVCPQGDVSVLDAQCSGGYCAPPVGAAPCDVMGGPSENTCFLNVSNQHSCQPFVDPQSKTVSWSCALIVGNGASGDACTTGSQCRSGFCGSNGTCFRPCTNSGNDCPQHDPPLACKKVSITVEGVTISASSCVP